MKPFNLLAASGLAMTLAACGSEPPPVRTALECPPTQGDLTRTAAAADGKACTYVTSGGAEVSLQLVSAPGGPDAALANIETTLLAGREAAKPDAEAKDTGASAADAKEKPAAAADDKDLGKSAAQAAQEAHADTQGLSLDIRADSDAGRRVRVEGSGRGVVTDIDGTTRVDLPGIHIVANDRDDTANVRVGPITVNAGDGAATIRMRRDVRLRGEALSREKRGIRATFVYTGDDLPSGYRFVGYEAGGPKAGPITVAIVRSKDGEDADGDIYPDVKKLVRKNGGV